jgi:DinB superfamily
MDDPLVELTPGPAIPVAPVLRRSRDALVDAWSALAPVSDTVLELAWPWRAGDELDADIRYGFYRIHERLEEAVAGIARGRLVSGEGPDVGPTVPILASSTAARWELRAAVAALGDADLDRDPGGGEWTVRQTLGHIVNSQRGYGWYNAWWLDRGDAPGPLPARAGDERLPELPDEETEAVGTRDEIMARFDGLVDQGAERFATIDSAALAIPARWSGLRVDLAFRIGRLGSHIREHVIQVDKTVVMLGRPTTEVERLIRLTGASYGRLEGLVFARSAESLATPFPDGGSATAILDACAIEIRGLGTSIAGAAARAGA